MAWKRIYSAVLCATLLASSSMALAGGGDFDAMLDEADVPVFHPGLIFGVQLGVAVQDYKKNDLGLNARSVDDTGFAGRAYLAYAFNEWIATEVGYTYLPMPKFKDVAQISGLSDSFRVQGVDWVAKFTLPLQYHFGFYAKGGLIWLQRGGSKATSGGTTVSTSSERKITFTAGAGFTYNFTPRLAAEAFVSGSPQSGGIEAITFFGLGMSYKFATVSA